MICNFFEIDDIQGFALFFTLKSDWLESPVTKYKTEYIMPDNKTFLIVKKHIDKMDYYGLLASGAPQDEFDSEAQEISTQIQPGLSTQEIASIIAQIFNSNFDKQDDATVFLPVAQQIKNELHL